MPAGGLADIDISNFHAVPTGTHATHADGLGIDGRGWGWQQAQTPAGALSASCHPTSRRWAAARGEKTAHSRIEPS